MLDQVAALAGPLAHTTPADWFSRAAQMAADHGLYVAGSLLEALRAASSTAWLSTA